MPFRRKGYDDQGLSLDDLMTLWPATVPVFLRHGMHCVGCPIGPFHTVVEACAEYGLDEDAFRAELERAIIRAAG
jgi:hybrid cluster-associated redox disulfide protein